MTTGVPQTDRVHLKWLDILKFFGIAMVIFGHISEWYINIWLYTFHVPLFFIAGGMVYRPKKIVEDIKHRAFKILVPYFVFGVIILLYYHFLERPFRDVDVPLAEGFVGLLVGDIEHLSFHSHLWFLPCYFLTAVVYNVLYNLLKPLGCGIVCSVSCIAYVMLPMPSLPWGIDRMCGYLGLFAIGNFVMEKKLIDKAQKLPLTLKLLLAAGLIIISVLLSWLRLTGGIMWIICAVIGTAGFIMLSMAIEKAEVFARVGQMTLTALCIHGPIYRVLIKLLSMALNTPTDTIRINVFAAIGVTAVTLAICCAAHLVLKRFVPWSIGVYPSKKPE